jgi:hypothetical protein
LTEDLMANFPQVAAAPRTSSAWAALLSYLMPGLGQIFQGRVAKGLLFMVSLYTLFFYGMYLGNWKNVYLPRIIKENRNPPGFFTNLYNRLHFAGQVWIGVAAWPAVAQYATYPQPSVFGTFERTPSEDEVNDLQRDGDKTWDLGWVYTVIAGVLNILVIYDAFAGAAFAEGERAQRVGEGVPA